MTQNIQNYLQEYMKLIANQNQDHTQLTQNNSNGSFQFYNNQNESAQEEIKKNKNMVSK